MNKSKKTLLYIIYLMIVGISLLWTKESTLANDHIASLQIGSDEVNLNAYLYLYSDKTDSLNIDEIRERDSSFVRNTSALPIYWWNSPTVWGRFDVSNKNHPNQKWFLVFNYPMMEYVDIYIPLANGKYKKIETSHYQPIQQRGIKDRKIIIPINLLRQKGSQQQVNRVYFKILSKKLAFDIPLVLVTHEGLRDNIRLDTAIHAAYYGILIMMVLYNFFIFLTTRDRSYLMFVLFILSFMFNMAASQGFLTDKLPNPKISIHFIIALSAAASVIMANFFLRDFLNTKKNLPRMDKFILVLQALLGLGFLSHFISIELFVSIHFPLLFISSLTSLTCGALLYRENTYSRHYTHANFLLFVATILFSLRGLGLDFYLAGIYSLVIGNLAAILLLSFALGSRIRVLTEESRLYEVLHKEIAFAGELQKYLFPQKNPVTEEYSVVAQYYPASAICGDFYDHQKLENGNLSFFLADVSGHGYSAGIIAAMVKVAYHETMSFAKKITDHQKQINKILCRHVHNAFVTAINMQIDPKKRIIHYTRSGQSPLLHYHKKTNTIEEHSMGSMPLAVTNAFKCTTKDIPYEPGDRLFLYTDGLLEEVDSNGEEYGVERIQSQIMNAKDMNAWELSLNISDDIVSWKNSDQFEDDVTFIVIDLR